MSNQPSGLVGAVGGGTTSSSTPSFLKLSPDDVWKNKTEKISGELFILTYGSLVAQIVEDFEDYDQVNVQLFKLGYDMGCRLIEDFLAKTSISKCSDFKETVDVITKAGFKIFLGFSPSVDNWSYDGKECSLIFDENPLSEFVELPDAAASTLWYSNIYCGIIKGALEMVQLEVQASFVSDVLRGDEKTVMRLKFIKMLDESGPMSDE